MTTAETATMMDKVDEKVDFATENADEEEDSDEEANEDEENFWFTKLLVEKSVPNEKMSAADKREWNMALRRHFSEREKERRTGKMTIKGAWIMSDVYRIMYNRWTGKNISAKDWMTSYEGSVMSSHIRGVDVVMTRKEFDAIPIPPSGNMGERRVHIARRNENVPLPIPMRC
jgi:hypothetical protein